ncbi:hypothetical protein ACHAWF_004637 [Thalassiosira exigua]
MPSLKRLSRIAPVAAVVVWALNPFAVVVVPPPYAVPTARRGDASPYTPDRLAEDPHLGWSFPLPPPSPSDGPPFSWRDCFPSAYDREDAPGGGGTSGAGAGAGAGDAAAKKPPGCREDPADLSDPPPVSADWIPDPTSLRTMLTHGKDREGNPFPPPLPRELCEDVGPGGGRDGDDDAACFREAGIRSLGSLSDEAVMISPWNHHGIATTTKADDARNETSIVEVPAPAVLCLTYATASAHAARIRAARETWAGGCDGYLAFSTRSDPRLSAVKVEHDGPEAYDNMWQKVRSMWKYVGAHYLDDYDWFFVGGDDLFVLPHNLKTYLASLAYKDRSDPKTREYYVGRRMKMKYSFNSGGAGYALSRAALRKFLAGMDDVRNCHARERTSMEDVRMANCLRHLGIGLTDTRDAEGRERFHPFSPGKHLRWKPLGKGKYDWFAEYGKEWEIKRGKDCCAPDSVSFHYLKDASRVRHVHALLHSCG